MTQFFHLPRLQRGGRLALLAVCCFLVSCGKHSPEAPEPAHVPETERTSVATVSINLGDVPHAGEAVAIWDAGQSGDATSSAVPIAPKSSWTRVRGESAAVAGDACAMNQHILLVLRKGARGAECYYRMGDKAVKAAELIPASGRETSPPQVKSCRVIKNTDDHALLEAEFAAAGGKDMTVGYLVKRGKPFVETRAGVGARKMMLEARGKYGVLPDVFGGDLVLGASRASATRVRFPSEHMMLELLEDRNAILMCVWRSPDQRVTLCAEDSGRHRVISGMEIEYGKEKDANICVAVLAAPGIWHEKKIGSLNAIKDTLLDWKVPFRALWRVNYPRQDGFNDSWKCLVRKADGTYESFGAYVMTKARTAFVPGRGTFAYPACMDGDRAYLRNSQFEKCPDLKYDPRGSAVIYPFRTIDGSPANVYGVVDVLREALKDTPQASLHEKLQPQRDARDIYPLVCDVTAEYEKIFDEREERSKKAYLLQRLDGMNHFVIVICDRIQEYLNWAAKTRQFLTQAKADTRSLAELADEFNAILGQMNAVHANRKLSLRTPAAAQDLAQKVIALIDSNDDQKVEKARQLGRDARRIGSSIDRAVSEFRFIVKELRQRAGLRMLEARNDAAFGFCWEIRQRTMEMLRSGFVMEGIFMD